MMDYGYHSVTTIGKLTPSYSYDQVGDWLQEIINGPGVSVADRCWGP